MPDPLFLPLFLDVRRLFLSSMKSFSLLTRSRRLRYCAPVLAVPLLTACASFSSIAPSAKPIEQVALAMPAGTAQSDDAVWPAEKWWTAFGDPQLTKLIHHARTDRAGLRLRARFLGQECRAAARCESAAQSGRIRPRRRHAGADHLHCARLCAVGCAIRTAGHSGCNAQAKNSDPRSGQQALRQRPGNPGRTQASRNQ